MDYKESLDAIQRRISFQSKEIDSSEPGFFDYFIDIRNFQSQTDINDALQLLFNDLFSPQKEQLISALSKMKTLLQSNAYMSKSGSIKEKKKDSLKVPFEIVKRLDEIVHLRFHFQKQNNFIDFEEDNSEDEYEEDFEDKDGDDIKTIALECLSLLLVDDLLFDNIENTPVFETFLTYFSNDSSIIAFTLYCNHSPEGRRKVFHSDVITRILEIIGSTSIKFSLLCSLCNSFFQYPFDSFDEEETVDEIKSQSIAFLHFLCSKWEEVSFDDKSFLLCTINNILINQPSFDDLDFLKNIVKLIFDNGNLHNDQYMRQCIKFFFNLLSFSYDNSLFEMKEFIYENGFFDFLFAVIQIHSKIDGENHIILPTSLSLLIEKTFICFSEEILDNCIWKNFLEFYDSSLYNIQISIALGFSVMILNDEISDVRLFPLTDTETVFRILANIQPQPSQDIFLPIVNSLIKLSECSIRHNSTSIPQFIEEDNDFHSWVDEFYEETTDPSFMEEKDPNIVNSFNDNVKKWLYLDENEEK